MFAAAFFSVGAQAHQLASFQDPNVAGDSAAHVAADAINVRTSSRERKMIRQLRRIARARIKKRLALGLPAVPPVVSDQGVRQRGFLQMMGFDISLTSPNTLAPRAYAASTSSVSAATLATPSGPNTQALGDEGTKGLWSPVIWPTYDTTGLPDAANPNTTGHNGSIPDPKGDDGSNPNPRIVPVFEALLPNGKVLYWDWLLSGDFNDQTQTMSTRVLMWDPSSPDTPGVRLDVPNANLFCAGFTHLPNGDLLLAGGNSNLKDGTQFAGLNQTWVFHWRTQTWQKGRDMSRTRWYPSVAALYNGDSLILGGDPNNYAGNENSPQPLPTPEVVHASYTNPNSTQNNDASANTITPLTNISFGSYHSPVDGTDSINPPSSRGYPFLVPSVDGRVLDAGYESVPKLIDTNGAGAAQTFAEYPGNFYRIFGSFSYYSPGKVMLVGGGTTATWSGCDAGHLVGSPGCQMDSGQNNEDQHGGTSAVTKVDLIHDGGADNTQGLPTSTNSTAGDVNSGSLNLKRRFDYATSLPDGEVLVTGGMSTTDATAGEDVWDDNKNNNLVNTAAAVKEAEIWSPATGHWTTLAAASVVRQYHSTAMLLPDGRVLTGGGGVCGPCTTGRYYNPNFEIFSPPYLFNSDGSPAARPAIPDAAASVHDGGADFLPPADYGASFDLPYSLGAAGTTIQKVSLLKLGAPTHSVDQGQRFVPLNFTDNSAAHTLHVTAPPNSYEAPPGYYMLFIVDSNGVPSISKTIQIGANLALHNIASVVDVFADPGFAGNAQHFGLGEFVSFRGNLANVGSGAISSIKVAPGYQLSACADYKCNVCHTFAAGDYPKLTDWGLNNDIVDSWTEPVGGAGCSSPPDNTPPVVKISSPVNGQVSMTSSIAVKYTVSDNLDQDPACDVADGTSMPLAGGANKITVTCKDAVGNLGMDSVTVSYASGRPSLKAPAKIKLAKKLSFTATCPTGCVVASKLVVGKKKIKLKNTTLKASAKAVTVSLSLTSKQFKTLKAALKKKQKIMLQVSLADGASQKASISARLK